MNNANTGGIKNLLRLLRDEPEEDDHKTTSISDFHARCMDLRRRYDALNQTSTIRPGMFVRIKPGISPLYFAGQPEDNYGRPRAGLPGIPWIVLRKLDMNDVYDQMIVADRVKKTLTSLHGYRAEWLIATTPNDQRHLVLEIASGDILEPIPADEIRDL